MSEYEGPVVEVIPLLDFDLEAIARSLGDWAGDEIVDWEEPEP